MYVEFREVFRNVAAFQEDPEKNSDRSQQSSQKHDCNKASKHRMIQ